MGISFSTQVTWLQTWVWSPAFLAWLFRSLSLVSQSGSPLLPLPLAFPHAHTSLSRPNIHTQALCRLVSVPFVANRLRPAVRLYARLWKWPCPEHTVTKVAVGGGGCGLQPVCIVGLFVQEGGACCWFSMQSRCVCRGREEGGEYGVKASEQRDALFEWTEKVILSYELKLSFKNVPL